nr:RNA-directed DNA polymerase, eukaryota [Tanacetum cinerariifolium]
MASFFINGSKSKESFKLFYFSSQLQGNFKMFLKFKARWPPRVTLGRLLPHARGLGFKPRREGFPSGAKKEWGLSPKAKVRVLHTAQLDVTTSFHHSFRRLPRGGVEQTQYDEFVNLMQQVILAPTSDRWTWTLNSSGEFSVASVRKLIENKICLEGEQKTRWINCIPTKVNTHAWKGVETTSHLFFTCEMAQQVMHQINRWWEVPDMEINSYDTWKNWVVSIRMPSKNKMMFEGVYYVMWWLLLSFRNKKIFEVKAPIKAIFFEDVVYKSFYWCYSRSTLRPALTLGRLLPHARGLGFKPRREGFPSGAKKEWGLSPKAKVRVLHTAQLDVTVSSNH